MTRPTVLVLTVVLAAGAAAIVLMAPAGMFPSQAFFNSLAPVVLLAPLVLMGMAVIALFRYELRDVYRQWKRRRR